jgi:hypothetical protein
MAAPTKEQREQRTSRESRLKRDGLYYTKIEQQCDSFADYMNEECFIPYGLKHSIFIRQYFGNSKKEYYLTLITNTNVRHQENYFTFSYPILEQLHNHELYNEQTEDHIQKSKNKPTIESIKNHFQVDIEDLPIHFQMPVITSLDRAYTNYKRALVEIDFTKPIEEITALVCKIKENFDQDNSCIESLPEYLGLPNKDEILTCNIKGCDIYKHGKTKPLSGRLVDALFIYDCKKLELTKEYAMNEINRYWNEVRNLHREKISKTTYPIYLKFAQDYIENSRYSEFLLGSKNLASGFVL